MCDCASRVDRYPAYLHADILAGRVRVDCERCYQATLYTPPEGSLAKAHKQRGKGPGVLPAEIRQRQRTEQVADLISHHQTPMPTGSMFRVGG